MVAMPEELDWLAYASYDSSEAQDVGAVIAAATEPVAPGHQPFGVLMARADEDADDDEESAWWSRNRYERALEVPAHCGEEMRSRGSRCVWSSFRALQSCDLSTEQPTSVVGRLLICGPRLSQLTNPYLLDRLEDLLLPAGR